MPAAPRVRFLVPGVQKAGTTALHDYLSTHPDLALPSIKEAHFFDDESVDWLCPDYRPYEALFDGAGARLCGECTPIYLYWPNSLERIAAYNPAMKFIVMLRDPVERAWSHYRMEYARGADAMPFAKAIREGRERFASAGVHRVFSYVERGLYADQIARLFTLFGRDNTLILKGEDLKAEPRVILDRVCSFLRIPPFNEFTPITSHIAADIDYRQDITHDDRITLAEAFAADQERLEKMTGIQFNK